MSCRALALCLLLLPLALPLAAQKRKPAQPDAAAAASAPPAVAAADSLTHAQRMYQLAIRYRDAQAAVYALYHQLAEAPDDVALKDSLASLYFVQRNYPQALAVARELLAADPQNLKMLQLAAISEQSLGRTREALEAYERLYAVSRSSFHLYQVAVLQYALQRYGECQTSIAAVLQAPDATQQQVNVALGNQQSQDVPLLAAAHNVRGVVLRDLKDPAGAREAFQTALKLMPDFVLAKNNLAALDAPPGK